MNADVMLGRTPEPDGKTHPADALAKMLCGMDTRSLFRGPLRSFSDARLRDLLKDVVYGGTSLPAFFRPPLVGGAVVFLSCCRLRSGKMWNGRNSFAMGGGSKARRC